MIVNPQTEIVDKGYISSSRELRVQGNSIDLTVDKVFIIDPKGLLSIRENGDRMLPNYKEYEPVFGTEFWFEPGVLYQVSFFEHVSLPSDIAGITFMRSTMNKSGASGEPGLFDSGYNGGTGITVTTMVKTVVERGASIAQMVFFRSDSQKMYDGFYVDDQWLGEKQ